MSFDLARFRHAQDRDGTYERALAELRQGHKRTHWMWFVFPQLAGLGHSAMAGRYGIVSIAEARAYLEDEVLGERLHRCANVLTGLQGVSAEQVLGHVDAMKLRSSMTLFCHAAPRERVFRAVLERFYGGEEDPATLALLGHGR